MKVHFIAIGGSAMHNLAIALSRKGYLVTGSDDEIFQPSKGRLEKEGLLPQSIGWDPRNITNDLDAVILGMHAKKDNPELIRAKDLGIKIYSYPEYLFEQSKDKKRIVIGGSHGKTTVTSMILLCLNSRGIDHDYMVGAQLEGYDCMVKLSESAPIMILEGDEYLSSPIDLRPKFHLYKPHISIITGIAWDHINVFPTWENYVSQFKTFIETIEDQGKLFYYENDRTLASIAHSNSNIQSAAYSTPNYSIDSGLMTISDEGERSVDIIGKHNAENLKAAQLVCQELGVSKNDFYDCMRKFTGASKRLEVIAKNDHSTVFKDFAHSPSKLKSTTSAVKEQFPDKDLISVMELHTFSSLNKEFLPQYEGSMERADQSYIYFSPAVIAHKNLPELSIEDVKSAFGNDNLKVFTDSEELISELLNKAPLQNSNLLIMTSGNLNGKDLDKLGLQMIT